MLEFDADGKYIRDIGHHLYAWSFAHNKDGNWPQSWGQPGSGPGQFNTPHTIAIDDADNVYVGDRGNGRIQVFDRDGKYLREIHIDVPYDHTIRPWLGNMPAQIPPTPEAPAPINKTMRNGSPWGICITPGPHQVLYACHRA